MAEKKDLTKLSKGELVERLQRQDKLLVNRKFVKSLPDHGEKICKLVEKLKEQIALREQAEDLSNRFKRFTIGQQMNAKQDMALDSDDDDDECDDDDDECDDDECDDDDTMVVSEEASYVVPQEKTSCEESAHKKPLSEKWAYDSAVTCSRLPVFEKAKVLSLEESRQLQVTQKEEQEALKAKHAAEKLIEQINWSWSQTSSTGYHFSSKEAKMKYREEEDEKIQENEEDSESEEKLYVEQEESDED